MADFTQSTTQTLIAHDQVAHPATLEGTEIACATWISVDIVLRYAPVEAVATAGSGLVFILQKSLETSGDVDWQDVMTWAFTHGIPATEVLTATEPIGEKVIAVAATAGFVANDIILVEDASDATKNEWHRVQEIVTNTSVNLLDGLAVEMNHVTPDVLWGEAVVVGAHVEVEAWKRFRLLGFHEEVTGPDIAFWATAVGATDFV